MKNDERKKLQKLAKNKINQNKSKRKQNAKKERKFRENH